MGGEKYQKKVVISLILVIALLTISTVNATNIMANSSISGSVVHESHTSTSLIKDDSVVSESNLDTSNDDSVVYESNNDKSQDVLKSNYMAKSEKIAKDDDVYSYSNFNTTNTQTTKNLKSSNDKDVLSDSSPVIVNVHNSAELVGLFNRYDAIGVTSENLVINLLGDDDYVLTKSKTITRAYSATVFKLINLTINGNNKVINGDGKYNCIYFDFNDQYGLINVMLNNITFKNCKSGQGGAIYSVGG